MKPTLASINHIAIAVPNLKKALEVFSKAFNNKISPIQSLKEHGVNIAWIECGNSKIEIMEPLGKDSPLSSFLQKNPYGGIHHLCSEVTDLKQAVEHLTTKAIDTSPVKKGANNSSVCFIKPKDLFGTLLELQEKE